MRIDKHPILDEQAEAKSVTIYVDGNAVQRAFLRTWLDVADNENDAGAVR